MFNENHAETVFEEIKGKFEMVYFDFENYFNAGKVMIDGWLSLDDLMFIVQKLKKIEPTK